MTYMCILLQNFNILSQALHHMIHNWVAKKQMFDTYKKNLEQSKQKRGIAINRVKVLERKISDLEGVNLKLLKTNATLAKINERLRMSVPSKVGVAEFK